MKKFAFLMLVPILFFTLFHALTALTAPAMIFLESAGASESVQVVVIGVFFLSAGLASIAILWRAWNGFRTDTPMGLRFEFEFRPEFGNYFPTDSGLFPALLRCHRPASHVVSGWGDHRIQVAGVDIAFQVEEEAIRASFEGDISQKEATEIAEGLRENIERESGIDTTLREV